MGPEAEVINSLHRIFILLRFSKKKQVFPANLFSSKSRET
jgi:hypothetical protein